MVSIGQGLATSVKKLTPLSKKGCLFLLGVLFILGIGLRPSTVGTDTPHYQSYYHEYFLDEVEKMEPLFHQLVVALSSLKLPTTSLFSTIACINFLLILLLVRTLSKKQGRQKNVINETRKDIHLLQTGDDLTTTSLIFTFERIFLLLMTFFMISPFFFSGMTNVIRQGTASLSLFVVLLQPVLAPTVKRQLLYLMALVLLAAGFHQSSLLFLFFFPFLFLSLPQLHGLVCGLFVGYLTGFSMWALHFLSNLSRLNIYERIIHAYPDAHYRMGVRFDFAVFTIFMGFFFHFLSQICLKKPEDKIFFSKLLKPYWILTFSFFLCGFGAYSDRLLLAPWMYLSILAAAFIYQLLRQLQASRQWDMLFFMIASFYFCLKLRPSIRTLFTVLS
ncbi:MAG: EpsG family protein [Legionella sp.]|nr:EpsG family protein [Legionella sp.]